MVTKNPGLRQDTIRQPKSARACILTSDVSFKIILYLDHQYIE